MKLYKKMSLFFLLLNASVLIHTMDSQNLTQGFIKFLKKFHTIQDSQEKAEYMYILNKNISKKSSVQEWLKQLNLSGDSNGLVELIKTSVQCAQTTEQEYNKNQWKIKFHGGFIGVLILAAMYSTIKPSQPSRLIFIPVMGILVNDLWITYQDYKNNKECTEQCLQATANFEQIQDAITKK